MPRVTAKLYVIPASHPSMAVRLMLERKGIAYKRRDLIPVVSKGALRIVGFPGTTVPALKIGRRKIQGSREIARALDQIQPEPALLPADPAARAEVEEAEAWGDDTLQGLARRILWNALGRDRAPLESYSEGAKLGVPVGLAVKTAAPIVALATRLNDATDENARADLAALPAVLQRIDDWIAAGVLSAQDPNAATFQIAPSVRLLMTLDDLRPAIEGRPAGELAMTVAPDYPGKTPPILPVEWLEGLDAQASAATA
jgi:glutathione S-transferase